MGNGYQYSYYNPSCTHLRTPYSQDISIYKPNCQHDYFVIQKTKLCTKLLTTTTIDYKYSNNFDIRGKLHW